MQKQCARNRKRSKRRAIYCPIHGCYLDSVSQKHSLYADQASHLRSRGVGRRSALLLLANQTTVSLEGEWLEAFWCNDCQETRWYHVRRGDRGTYNVSIAPQELWQQVDGVIQPSGNPSVSEFSYRQARRSGQPSLKDFGAIH